VSFTGPRGTTVSLQLSSDEGKVAGKWEFGRGDEQAKRLLAQTVTQLLRPPSRRSEDVGSLSPA
jgi:hypothetical protein